MLAITHTYVYRNNNIRVEATRKDGYVQGKKDITLCVKSYKPMYLR